MFTSMFPLTLVEEEKLPVTRMIPVPPESAMRVRDPPVMGGAPFWKLLLLCASTPPQPVVIYPNVIDFTVLLSMVKLIALPWEVVPDQAPETGPVDGSVGTEPTAPPPPVAPEEVYVPPALEALLDVGAAVGEAL